MTPVDDRVDFDAAEYVLGTLDSDERSAFEKRLRSDGAAKRAVSDWESRLAGLVGMVAPVAPPTTVWERIEQALQSPVEPSRAFRSVDSGFLDDHRPRITASRNRWRAAAMSFGSIAAALVAFIALDRAGRLGEGQEVARGEIQEGASAGNYVAAVNRGGDKPALIVRVDLKTRQVFVIPVAAETPTGRSLELWYIGEDKAPRAMGLVDKSPATMPIPAGVTTGGATFAVSVEPPGGSTTGGPTGPVVYSGQLIRE